MSIYDNKNMKDERLKFLAKNIKAERIRRGLTQAQLAELIMVSERSISQIEQCRQMPSAFKVFDIASALDIPIEELFKNVPKVNSVCMKQQ